MQHFFMPREDHSMMRKRTLHCNLPHDDVDLGRSSKRSLPQPSSTFFLTTNKWQTLLVQLGTDLRNFSPKSDIFADVPETALLAEKSTNFSRCPFPL